MEWLEGKRIAVDPPKRPKKITGTRLAAIMGLNKWTTPFNAWCAITRTYEEPFVDTIYTIAGKTIEPKQAEYMKRAYLMDDLVTPTDVYGADYFKKTYGDFFKESPIFGGMWDYLLCENGKPYTVLEMKTTKRAEDWGDDIPEYYAMQAALYAYLLGVDEIIMVASFLEDKDYEHPENFKPSVKNTILVPFKLSKRYPNFYEDCIAPAEKFWKEHVLTGISPEYDEKADADILKALRTNNPQSDDELSTLIAEAEQLKAELDEAGKSIAEKEKRYKTLTDVIKKFATEQFREGDTKVAVSGSKYVFTLARSKSVGLDEAAMKKDGVYDKYNVKEKTSYRLTVSKKED